MPPATPSANESIALDHNDPGVQRDEPRNLATLILYQITLRVGWIFKTESVVMPAFLDAIGGTGWMRGLLPAINRLGHSVAPVLFAPRLKRIERKKWSLAGCSLAMAVSFLALAGTLLATGQVSGGEVDYPGWLPAVFLALYTLFFISTGLNQLSLTTLHGKLIRPQRRGRLLLLSTTIGAAAAIFMAWLLMGPWLADPNYGFGYIFGFTGVCFVVAAALGLGLAEPADRHGAGVRETAVRRFVDAWRALADDRGFRRLAVVAMLFSTTLVLFPHYQALAFERFDDLEMTELLPWVMVQNFGTALFSVVAGVVADRSGNRLALRVMLLLAAATPVVALAIASSDAGAGRMFIVVFAMLGLTPITMRTLANFTLEIVPTIEHPRYVSTLSLCLAAPPCLSPLVGLAVDAIGFAPVFITGAGLMLLGALLTFTIDEPRHTAPVRDTSGHLPEQ